MALLDGDVAQVAAAGDGRAVELGRLESAARVIELADEVGRLPEAVATDLAGSVADHLRQTGRADLAVLVSDMNVPADEIGTGGRPAGAGRPVGDAVPRRRARRSGRPTCAGRWSCATPRPAARSPPP